MTMVPTGWSTGTEYAMSQVSTSNYPKLKLIIHYNIQIFETPHKVSTETMDNLQYNGKVGKNLRITLLM